MIVRRLLAVDLLKYERLELSGLPVRGVVAMTGPNEAGKSSIGEILCLALFGRTFQLPDERVGRAIRWDQPQGRVEVELLDGDGDRWLVVRELDQHGARDASLGPADATEPPLRGWDAVTAALRDRLGFSFAEYVESFYLSRRESPPAPKAETVRGMAGVLPLERVGADLQDRSREEQEGLLAVSVELDAVRAELERFNPDDLLPPRPGRVFDEEGDELLREASARADELARVRDQVEERYPAMADAAKDLLALDDRSSHEHWSAAAERLDATVDAVEESVSFLGWTDMSAGTERTGRALDRVQGALGTLRAIHRGTRKRRAQLAALLGEPGSDRVEGLQPFDDQDWELEALGRGLGRAVGFHRGLAILCGLVAAAAAVGLRFELLPVAAEAVMPLRIGAAVLGAAAVLFLSASARAAHRLGRIAGEREEIRVRKDAADREARLLDGLLVKPVVEAVAALRSLPAPKLQSALDRFEADAGRVLLDPAGRRELAAEFAAAEGESDAAWDALLERIQSDREALGQVVELERKGAGLRARRDLIRDHLATVDLAVELLEGAVDRRIWEFNRGVRRSMGRVLPSLTEGRYQYLQIADDLSVSVFSTEKQDFIAYEEISGGTQRQVGLATRLALSEGLAEATDSAPQFLFLDEPFAFFDRKRTIQALRALPKVSDELPQVWVAVQELPDGYRPAVELECRVGEPVLVVGPGAS